MNVAVCDKLGCKKVADLFPKANELAVREILSSLLFLAPKKLETGKMLVLRKAREAHAFCVKITAQFLTD